MQTKSHEMGFQSSEGEGPADARRSERNGAGRPGGETCGKPRGVTNRNAVKSRREHSRGGSSGRVNAPSENEQPDPESNRDANARKQRRQEIRTPSVLSESQRGSRKDSTPKTGEPHGLDAVRLEEGEGAAETRRRNPFKHKGEPLRLDAKLVNGFD